MLSTSERLLRVLTLLESRREWSGADLAERLEVSTRTIRNDMVRLRTLGYPVGAASGVAGGYRLGPRAPLPAPLAGQPWAGARGAGRRSARRAERRSCDATRGAGGGHRGVCEAKRTLGADGASRASGGAGSCGGHHRTCAPRNRGRADRQ